MHARSRLLCLILALITFGTLVTPAGAATTPCQQEYRAAVTAVRSAHLGRGNEQKILTKLDNGWRKYASLTKNGPDQAVKEVQNALDLLDGNATKQIPPAEAATVRNAISSLLACLKTASVPPSGTLTVRTFIHNGNAPQTSAGAGVQIRIGDEAVAKTGSDGAVTFKTVAGPTSLTATRYPTHAGAAYIDLASNQSATLDIVLSGSKIISERNEIAAVELTPEGVLPSAAGTLTLRFSRDGQAIAVTGIAKVDLLAPDETIPVTHLFNVAADGSVKLVDVAGFRSLVSSRVDPFTLRIYAGDSQGNGYYNQFDFVLGRYALAGLVTAPAGASGARSGAFITATHASSGLVFRAVSDAAGAFHFPEVPDGLYLLGCESSQATGYSATQPVWVNGNTTTTLPLVSANEIPPLAAATMPGAVSTSASKPDRAATGAQTFAGTARTYPVVRVLFELVGGQFLPSEHYYGTVTHRLESKSEEELRLADELPDHGPLTVAVRMTDDAGQTIFRDVATAPRLIHAEVMRPDGTFERVATTAPERQFIVVWIPLDEHSTRLHLRSGVSRGEFALDRIIGDRNSLYRVGVDATSAPALVEKTPNRVTLTVLGDGFVTEDKGLFEQQAANLATGFFRKRPYLDYASFVVFKAPFLASPQRFAKHPPYQQGCPALGACCGDSQAKLLADGGKTPPELYGINPNNLFGSTFCGDRDRLVNRLVVVDETLLNNVLAKEGINTDQLVILVNDSVHGGSGGGDGTRSVLTTGADDVVDVTAHEFGHTFTRLADEYVSTVDFPEGQKPPDLCDDNNPNRPCPWNVTNISNPSKWSEWKGVGADIGDPVAGGYRLSNYFRPTDNSCVMRTNGRPFCVVCGEAYVRKLYEKVTPIDSVFPAEGPVAGGVGVPQRFSVTTGVPSGARVITWKVNDVVQAGQSSTTFAFTPATSGEYKVEATVSDQTILVRPENRTVGMSRPANWTLTATRITTQTKSVTSNSVNVPVSERIELTLPAGISRFNVIYQVTTAETQNRCNGCGDMWKVDVFVNGQRRDPSPSGIAWPPVAQTLLPYDVGPNAGGLPIVVVFEARSLGTASHPTTLKVTTDHESPATSCGTPGPNCPAIAIETVVPDWPFNAYRDDYFSIPPTGQTNSIHKTVLVRLRQEPATATPVFSVTLVDADGNPIAIVPNPTVTRQTDGRYQVTLTYKEAVPPLAYASAHEIRYRIGVSLSAGSNTAAATQDLTTVRDTLSDTIAPLKALWRMPSSIRRFGARENVGDEWVTRGTYNWLVTNSGLITAVDNAAGEHTSFNVPNPPRYVGAEFDLFPFHRLTNTDSPAAEYAALQQLVSEARTSAAKTLELREWVVNTRAGIDRLIPAGVELITMGSGDVLTNGICRRGTLPDFWLRSLMTFGVINPASGGFFLDTQAGIWARNTSPNISYSCLNNEQYNVELSQCSIKEAPCPRRRAVGPRGPISLNSVTIDPGQTTTLTYSVTGEDVQYRWYEGALNDASKPLLEMSNSLTVTPAQTTSYWVLAFNWGGSVTSGATVTVRIPCTPPAITSEPDSKTIVQGQAASLSVTVTGTQPLYRWFIGAAGDTRQPIYRVDGPTLNVAPQETTQYWVYAVNGCGNASSATATITVKPPCIPASVATQPQPKSIIEGQTATLTVGAAGTALQYQWFQSSDRNGPFAPIPGATSASVSVAPIATTYYLVRIAGECGNAESVAVGVTVTPACKPPVLSSQPTSRSITEGESVTLGVTTTGTAPTYQWYIGQSLDTSSPVPNGTNASLVVTPLTTTSYWVRATNECGVANSAAAAIVVTPACTAPAITTQPQGGTLNPGQSLTLTAAATGSNPSYQWFVGLAEDTSSPVIGATSTTLVVSPAVTTRYWMRALNTCGIANTVSVIVTVTPACVAPAIVTPPQPTSIVEGQIAMLTVSASGTSLQYQWFAGAANDTSNPVSGGTSGSVAVSPGVSTTYWVRVSNECGTAPSAPALVTVNQSCTAPVVPQSTRTINSAAAGDSVTFEVVPTDGTSPLQFQWFASSPSGSPFVAVPGATQRIITVAPTSTSQYYLRVSNACGTADSGVITVVVPPPTTCTAPAISQHPQSQSVPAGDAAVLTVSATGTQPRSYRWYIGNSGDTTQPVPSSDSTTLVVTVNANTRRWVRVTNSCGTADSDTAILTATTSCTSPSIFSHPQPVTIEPGQSATLSVGASGTSPRTYQWYSGTGTLMSGANSSSVTVSPTVTTDYYVVVSNDCGTRTSQTARVTVESCLTPQITTQPQSQTVPFRGTVNLSVVATGQAPLSYRWYNGPSGDTTAPLFENGVPATRSSVTFQASTTTFYWVRVTNACGVVDSVAAKVTMLDCVRPVITQQPQSVTITAGQSATLTVGASNPGPGTLTYQWFAMGLDFPSPVPNGTSASITVSPSETTTYYVHVFNGCGMDSSQSVAVTVASCPTPSITSQPQSVTINAGQSTSLSVGASGSGLTYQWYVAASNQPVSNGTGSTLSVSPSETTSYYVIVRNACGNDARSNDATVTVNACDPPVVTSPVAQTNLLLRIGSTKALTVAANGSNLSYQWYASEPDGSSFEIIPGANGASVVVSPEETSRYYVRVTNPCGNADSAQWRITVWDGIGDPPDPDNNI